MVVVVVEILIANDFMIYSITSTLTCHSSEDQEESFSEKESRNVGFAKSVGETMEVLTNLLRGFTTENDAEETLANSVGTDLFFDLMGIDTSTNISTVDMSLDAFDQHLVFVFHAGTDFTIEVLVSETLRDNNLHQIETDRLMNLKHMFVVRFDFADEIFFCRISKATAVHLTFAIFEKRDQQTFFVTKVLRNQRKIYPGLICNHAGR